jgi:hypothetical protein
VYCLRVWNILYFDSEFRGGKSETEGGCKGVAVVIWIHVDTTCRVPFMCHGKKNGSIELPKSGGACGV